MDDVLRRTIEAWGATPLGRWVKDRLDRRIELLARGFFEVPYHSKRHREAFSRVLEALVTDVDGGTTRLGQRLRMLLRALDSPMAAAVEQGDYQVVRDARWLQAFFEDEPEWRPRLGAWLRRLDER